MKNKKTGNSFLKAFLVLVLISVFALAVYFYFFGPKKLVVDKSRYPITGIDVSRHNGIINWQEAKNQAIDFVYIKATEGLDYIDPLYKEHMQGARGAGIKVGAYHFFLFKKPGLGQAKNFLSNTRISLHDLPPVLDVEQYGNSNHNKSRKEVIREIKAFIKEIKDKTGKKTLIYTNQSDYDLYIRGNFDDAPVWICTLNAYPEEIDVFNWVFWQHDHHGRLIGFKEKVDINTFNGGRAEWEKFCEGNF